MRACTLLLLLFFIEICASEELREPRNTYMFLILAELSVFKSDHFTRCELIKMKHVVGDFNEKTKFV